jgi:hypothetical protein
MDDWKRAAIAREMRDTWAELARCGTPWADMPIDDVSGYWGRIAYALLAEHDDERTRNRTLRPEAVLHGEFRRRQLCPPQAVSAEIALMERVVEDVACETLDPPAARAVLRALRRDLRCIGRGIHAGYFDESLEPRRW